MFLWLLMLLAQSPLSPPSDGHGPPCGELGAACEAFRDGDGWITATRHGDGTATLTWPDGRSARATLSDHLLLTHDAPGSWEALEATLLAHGLVAEATLFERAGIHRVRSAREGEDGLAAAARVSRSADLRVFPDVGLVRQAHFVPPATDPRRGGQWFLDRIDIDAIWERSVGDPSVVIGVVDNGCDLAHPDLVPNLLPGRDLVDGEGEGWHAPGVRSNEHGTACAGLIAAVGNNGIGIVGACPTCRVRCVRLLPPDGRPVFLSADVTAFEQQLAWDVAVSSNSWGFVDKVPVPLPLRTAIETLMHEGRGGKGAIVVFAAGNDAREIDADELYGIPGVLTVGAINAFDEIAQFSNSGAVVDLVAPTGNLTTDISGPDGADPGDYMNLFGGTSSACPLVAGVAGLLVAAAPDRTAAEIITAMVRTTRPAPFATPDESGHDLLHGYGIIDPRAALDRFLPEAPDAEPEPAEPPPAVSAEGGCAGGPLLPWLGLLALPWLARRKARLGPRERVVGA